MTPKRQRELLAVYRNGLLEDTLPFWLPRCIDKEHGGFLLMRDRDGSILDTDKGMWQQCRFTWLLGTLCINVEPRDEWLEAAMYGIEFIGKHGFDNDGRMWFHVTREGKPIRKRRYAFTETFGAIAYSILAKATSDDAFARKARELYDLAKQYFRGTWTANPKFTDTRPAKSIAAPMILMSTAQELRNNLGDDAYTAEIDTAIEEIRRDFLKPDIDCVMESVAPDGSILDHFDGRTLNPGHAIECAWFILAEARWRDNDPELIRLGCQMLDWMWARGWDEEHGGILYFLDIYGKPVQDYWHDMKFWWPHNEAIIATLFAWILTGDNNYAEMHIQVHNWAYSHFHDPEHGEWFGYLHRDGSISSSIKGNLWKGPFHLPRMQLVCWQLLDQMLG